MKTIKYYAMAAVAAAMLVSCSSDDDAVQEEEVITKLVLKYTNQANDEDTVTLTWEDANENEEIDEGEQTVVGEFVTGKVYDAEIGLFSGDEDFLEEDILVDQNGVDAHFFIYSTDLNFTMERAANDNSRTDGNKLGVKTVWTAGENGGQGNISVKLFHEAPNNSDADGFGTTEGTDTDIDVSFNVRMLQIITLE